MYSTGPTAYLFFLFFFFFTLWFFLFTMNSLSSLTFDPQALALCNPGRPVTFRHFRPSRNVIVCSAKPVASPPTKASVVPDTSAARIGSLSQVSGVLGCQWGDEGKGKLVDILAQHFEIVARCQVLRKLFSFSPSASFPQVSNRGSLNSTDLVCCVRVHLSIYRCLLFARFLMF